MRSSPDFSARAPPTISNQDTNRTAEAKRSKVIEAAPERDQRNKNEDAQQAIQSLIEKRRQDLLECNRLRMKTLEDIVQHKVRSISSKQKNAEENLVRHRESSLQESDIKTFQPL